MKQLIKLFLSIPLALISFTAGADTLLVDTQPEAYQIAIPARGSTMGEVENRFGAADTRLDAVGEPPITRWIYPSFIVYFEYDRVIHSVVNPEYSNKMEGTTMPQEAPEQDQAGEMEESPS